MYQSEIKCDYKNKLFMILQLYKMYGDAGWMMEL